MDEPWTGRTQARRPGAVPDLAGRGTDTDADGVPDTLLTADGADLLVQTDLDADGLVDRVLRIGLDGAVHVDPVAGHGAGWAGLLGEVFDPDQ